jgi:hypothetical protein
MAKLICHYSVKYVLGYNFITASYVYNENIIYITKMAFS